MISREKLGLDRGRGPQFWKILPARLVGEFMWPFGCLSVGPSDIFPRLGFEIEDYGICFLSNVRLVF